MIQADIHIGDCREVLNRLPAQSAHCVVTSPPYWGLRDYNVAGQIGLEPSIDEFLAAMVDVFRGVRRVLRADGTCWVNLGDTYRNKQLLGIPWRVALALQADGWYLRSDIIWHKPNPVPEPDRGRPTVAHEYLFLLTKYPKYYYDADAIRDKAGDEPDWDEYNASLGSNNGAETLRWSAGYKKCSHAQIHPSGRNKRSVWTIPTRGYRGAHFATFPADLVKPCILAGTSAMGCCEACGSPYLRKTEISPQYAARLGASWHDHKDDLSKGQRGVPPAMQGAGPPRVTVGWNPTCKCDAKSIPCTVLDPFGGSGTVGEVALQHGRKPVLIELNPDYEQFIRDRTGQSRLRLEVT